MIQINSIRQKKETKQKVLNINNDEESKTIVTKFWILIGFEHDESRSVHDKASNQEELSSFYM